MAVSSIRKDNLCSIKQLAKSLGISDLEHSLLDSDSGSEKSVDDYVLTHYWILMAMKSEERC
jgi:hypothetical protein